MVGVYSLPFAICLLSHFFKTTFQILENFELLKLFGGSSHFFNRTNPAVGLTLPSVRVLTPDIILDVKKIQEGRDTFHCILPGIPHEFKRGWVAIFLTISTNFVSSNLLMITPL